MVSVRLTLSTLLVAAGFALVGGPDPVIAQPPEKSPPPSRPPNYGDVVGFRTAGKIQKQDMAKAKAAFEAFAKFSADYVSYPRAHTAPQEFRPEPPPPGSPLSVDQLINEINRHLLVPSPVAVLNPNPTQPNFAVATHPDEVDYIREFGTALNKALGDVVRQADDRIVRVNAARMLAAACRSGAHAHYPTITELVSAPATDPEIRYYALQGAANLLAAYDLNDYRSRKHSNDPKAVGALVSALQGAVLKADALLPTVDVGVDKSVRKVVPPDQVPVYFFIRRQAVKALGQVRFAEYEVEKGKSLYPAHTLALVALGKLPVETVSVKGDKVEVVPAQASNISVAADAAEAVIGVCNMAPPKGGAAGKQYGAAMADVVATGVITWATPRAANPADKSLPWKGTAMRMDDALKTWQGVFDPIYDPAQPKITPALVPAPVAQVAREVTDKILEPMNVTTRAVGVTQLQAFQRDVLRRGKEFTNRPFDDPGAPALPPPQ